MISDSLLSLHYMALKMEKLLPTSSRQYRAMYAALEHDLALALDGVSQRMLTNYPGLSKAIPPDPPVTPYLPGFPDSILVPDTTSTNSHPDILGSECLETTPEERHDSSD
jgi:hypothetical protein